MKAEEMARGTGYLHGSFLSQGEVVGVGADPEPRNVRPGVNLVLQH